MRVNLGCGQVYMEGWTNVDASRDVKADIYMEAADFLRQYADEIDEVYMGHVLEHIMSGVTAETRVPGRRRSFMIRRVTRASPGMMCSRTWPM